MGRWIAGHVQQVICDIVSLGVRDSTRGKLLRRREATWAVVQSPPMGEHEDLVELLVQLRIWLVNGSNDHRGMLRIMCDRMEHTRNL